MPVSLAPIMRDYLIRFQQSSIKATGHRPLSLIHTPMDEPLWLPGCTQVGYSYWQPIAWNNEKAPVGSYATHFHQSIIEYVSLCQFLEIPFRLPIAQSHRPLSFLYQRVFETFKNTHSMPPCDAFEEAFLLSHFQKDKHISYAFARTCDPFDPLLLMIHADTGFAYIDCVGHDLPLVELHVSLDRLLPKLQFSFEGW